MDSGEKRNFKITNSRQFQALVCAMQENEQLAKSLTPFGTSRYSIEEAWDDVARRVNEYGPPERTGFEWKKIWADLKCRTKKKIMENIKIINTHGEGSTRVMYLSDLEQSVDRLLNLSSVYASQVLDESAKEFTFENDSNDISKKLEVEILPDDTASNIKVLKGSKTFANKKIKSQIRLAEKRKYEKREKQLRLLDRQINAQEKILEAIQMQATAAKAIEEAANKQAESLAAIAESTQSIALAVQEAIKHFKPV